MNNMKYNKEFKIAIKSLKTNKVRSVLSVLSIIIGILVVIVVISTGGSLKKIVNSQMESFGSNIIQTEVKIPGTSQASMGNVGGMAKGILITTLKDSDRKAILKLPYIDKAYSAVIGQKILSWRDNINRTNIFFVTNEFIDIDQTEISNGRFFSKEENESLAKVVVLGHQVKEDLFGNSDALNQTIKIDKKNFKVIGIAKPRGEVFGFDMDDLVYIPLETGQRLLLGIDYVSYISSEINNTSKEEETVDAISHLLRERHNISNPDRDDFAVVSMTEAKEMMDNVIGGITLLLIALAFISLIVGGVGIMNIMYVSVSERVFEIGLRKAVGSTKKDILNQFLIESIIITLLGGIGGVLLGFIITYLIYLIALYNSFSWYLSFSLFSIILSLSFSIIVGIVFGIRPAKKASELNPIQALRKE